MSPKPPDVDAGGTALGAPIAAPEIGRRRGPLGALPFLGPAFVAAIAYVDPGNFATNIAGGAAFGYLLLWVILAANLMAHARSRTCRPRSGIATGRNLPELCREHFPRPVSWGLWIQAELIAMATDLAEFVGAAIALNLLFDVPLFPAGLITAVVSFAHPRAPEPGLPRFETVIVGFLAVILLGFLTTRCASGPTRPAWPAGFMPRFEGTESVLLATGILGATVMPHVIYLHSALMQNRIPHAPDGRGAPPPAPPALRRVDRDGPRRPREHVDARHRRVAVPRARASTVTTIEGAHAGFGCWSARAPRWPSRSRCSPRASPARPWAR